MKFSTVWRAAFTLITGGGASFLGLYFLFFAFFPPMVISLSSPSSSPKFYFENFDFPAGFFVFGPFWRFGFRDFDELGREWEPPPKPLNLGSTADSPVLDPTVFLLLSPANEDDDLPEVWSVQLLSTSNESQSEDSYLSYPRISFLTLFIKSEEGSFRRVLEETVLEGSLTFSIDLFISSTFKNLLFVFSNTLFLFSWSCTSSSQQSTWMSFLSGMIA